MYLFHTDADKITFSDIGQVKLIDYTLEFVYTK